MAPETNVLLLSNALEEVRPRKRQRRERGRVPSHIVEDLKARAQAKRERKNAKRLRDLHREAMGKDYTKAVHEMRDRDFHYWRRVRENGKG